MADKGRDLKVSVLSDADQFDLGKPADDLERLGDAAQGAGQELSQLSDAGDQLASLGDDATGAARELDRLGDSGDQLRGIGDDAKAAADDVGKLGSSGEQLRELGDQADKAGTDVDGLGTDAKAAAAQVDGAFDKIAAASKRAGHQVNKSMDEGGKALDEFKDEAKGSGTEAAASFSGGFDDVTSFIQETVANGLSGLGAVGMAGGIAAAAGIGFLVSQLQAAQEKVNGIRQALVDLRMDGTDDAASRVQAVLDEMRDTDTLARFAQAAKDAGIDFGDYVRVLANGGPEAEAMKAKLDALAGSYGGLGNIAGAGAAAQDLSNRMYDQQLAAEGAAVEVDALADATNGLATEQEDTSVAVTGLADALAGFTSPVGVYTGLLSEAEQAERDRAQATADATKTSKDSWEDYAKDVSVSVDDYLAELERQVTAQENWASNLQTLAKRGVEEGVLAELEKMGPQGAPLVAKLTKASDAELAKLAALMRRKGQDGVDGMKGALASGRPGIAGEVQGIRDDMRDRLTPKINVPIGTTRPTAGQLAGDRAAIRNGIGTVTVPVMLQKVPQSIWSTMRSVP